MGNFEAAYTQAKAMSTQQQMSELKKLQLRGVSDKKIKNVIKDTPQLYNNLIDMVSDLQESGNEQAFAQAEAMKTYLPDMTPSMVENMMDEGIGVKGVLGGALGLGIAAYATNYLRSPSPTAISESKTKYKADVKGVKAQRAQIGKDLKSTNTQLNAERMKLVKEQNKNVARRSDIKIAEHKRNISDLNKRANDLKSQKPTTTSLRYQPPKSRLGSLLSKTPSLAKNIAGFAGLSLLPSVGEYLGKEEGREVGRAVSDVGLLGMAGKTLMSSAPGWGKVAGAALLGAEPLLRRGHDYFYGNEE